MKRRPKWSTITIALAVIAALAIATPVLGVSSSIKKAIKKEVSKQISSATGPAGPQGPPGPLAPSEPYHEVGAAGEPAFQNSWANFDAVNSSTAGFYKDPFGVVHLKGTLVNAVDNTIAFQLPPGYRPSKQHLMPMGSEAAGPVPVVAKLEIESDGEVRPDCDGAGCATAGIDGLTFRVP